jgi:predicted ArsR family transcriptional regulator
MVTATPVSAAEVAAVTGLAHAAASYHLRRLAAAELVEPIEMPAPSGRRGRPSQRYRMQQEGFRDLGPDTARLVNRALLSVLARRLEATGEDTRTVDAEVWLAERDWRRLVELIQEASAIVHERTLPLDTTDSKHVGFTTLLLDLG